MTTNIDRAVDVLAAEGLYCGDCCGGHCDMYDCSRDSDWRACPDCREVLTRFARALDDAGLLMPDLPESNDASFPSPTKGWRLGTDGTPIVWADPGATVMIQRIEPGDLFPAQARRFALNILAAAGYSETTTNREDQA